MSSLPPPLLYEPYRAVDEPPANDSPPFDTCLDDSTGSPITLTRTVPETPPKSTAPTICRNPQTPPPADVGSAAPPDRAAVSALSDSLSTPGSSLCSPLLSLMGTSVIDLLDADPRPSFVVSLASPATDTYTTDAAHPPSEADGSSNASGVLAPYIVYGNPALNSSPLLREIVAPGESHRVGNWIVITADAANGHSGALPAVHHLGVFWTRLVLGGGLFIVFSANVPMPVEAAVRTEPPAHPPVPAIRLPTLSPVRYVPPETAATSATTTTTTTKATAIPASQAATPHVNWKHLHPYIPAPPTLAYLSPYKSSPHLTYGTLPTVSPNWTAAPFPGSANMAPAAGGTGRREDGSYESPPRGKNRQYSHHLEAVADLVPIGLLALDPEENVCFANQSWYRIMGAPPTPEGTVVQWDHFFQFIEEEYQPALLHSFEQIVRVPSISFGFRVKRHGNETITSADQSSGSTQVLATSTVERDTEGNLVRVIICLREIIEEYRSITAAADLYAQQANNLRCMTEYATVGLYDMDIEGRLRDANRVFIEMCGMDIEEGDNLAMGIVKPWLWCVIDEDRSLVNTSINTIVAGGEYQSMEVRLSKPWTIDDGAGNRIEAPRWIDATMLPIKDAKGNVISITGCATDVSLRKWQLERERQVKEEAIESRRQQENFVDVTSHEIRNPLTVIMHCADAVLESLKRICDLAAQDREPMAGSRVVAAESESVTLQKALVDDAIDYTEIIVGSALHQKSIVDDILTMSKLDSDLLTVTAVTVDPIEIVRSTLWMFEVQARQQSISLNMVLARSFKDLVVDYFDLDPSRLKQILINLLTNALKFTCSGDMADGSIGPMGSSVFLIFEVKDTGEGLTKEGRDTLFQKFVQVNSTTHVKHGGSGLGLFISKRLAELQNGAIGVASQLGVGSTFTFYIEAYISPRGVVPEVLTPAEAAKKALAVGLSAPRERNADESTAVLSPGLSQASPEAATKGTTRSARNSITKTSETQREATEAAPDKAILDNNGQHEPLTTKATSIISGDAQLAVISETPPEVRGVLLVEDNMVNQKVTRRYFEKGGFSVQVAGNGLEAMEKIQQSDRCVPGSFPISVVLMDMEMPVQGGLECTQNIRALEATGMFSGGRIPVVMITGNARPGQIADARAAGCDDVVIKPFQMQQLYEHIQLIIRMLWEKDRHMLAQREGEAAVAAAEVGVDAEASLQEQEL
ncbi:histidine kinase m1nbp [Grosmannia clavigera kw1407]|uniref:Histidine kinase m1nbp n=1 Tax=Grosmannia clavigera (strain kw1407 / UAMH 11150) TaxID=655863 RepID=F0XK24_GROCL|nr:histidine kinase m1nbp [Grosmannia clavigera kw1407]EFX01974.1 histidine kinase m1nbp [Grosmannia clavigera kw1407]